MGTNTKSRSEAVPGSTMPINKGHGLKELKRLAFEYQRKRYPNVPSKAHSIAKYNASTSNGLTKCIIDYIKFIDGHAERVAVTGRLLPGESYKDIFGKQKQLKADKWIKTSGRVGSADISGIYKGIPLSIEVKIGRDKLSRDQERYKMDVESAGGIYIVAKNFEQFYVEFTNRISNKSI